MAASMLGKTRQVRMLIGQVVQRSNLDKSFIKIRTVQMELDNRLNKYFNKTKDFWAVDKKTDSDIHDIVLIEKLPEKLTVRVTHEVRDIIFKFGRVVDPITGRRCRGTEFIDEEARKVQMDKLSASMET